MKIQPQICDTYLRHRYVKTCHTIEEFQKLPPGPKVVFASGASLEAGPSRALLAEWAPHSANLLLLPFTEAPDGTVASRVLTAAATATDEKEKFLRLQMSRRVPLEVRPCVDAILGDGGIWGWEFTFCKDFIV